MSADLHREVSRMIAGLVLFYEVNTKGDIQMAADRLATELIDRVRQEDADDALLGLATTRQLLAELSTRIEIDYYSGGGGLDYSTSHGRPETQGVTP